MECLEGGERARYSVAVLDDEEKKLLSSCGMFVRDTRFGENYVRTIEVAGVRTPPEYRRHGYCGELMKKMHNAAPELGAAVSMLHPFSFEFYRKYGYEKIADKIAVTMPMTALSFLPKMPDMQPYNDGMLPALTEFFEEFSKGRNTMCRRFDNEYFSPSNGHFFRAQGGQINTYVLYRGEKITGYVIYSPLTHYDKINHNISDGLYVYEIGFLDRKSLFDVLGFLRMYEGELDSVIFHDIAPVPELNSVFRYYAQNSYKIIPDTGARILDSMAMLRLVKYPKEAGKFTLEIEDDIENVAGIYHIEYENGRGEITKCRDGIKPDIIMPERSFVKFLYGAEDYNAKNAEYLEGIRLENDAYDFFRAFPKQTCGAFEFF